MALNLPTFYKRTGSAIVFAIIMLVGLLWLDLSYLILICIINALCLHEYFKLMKRIIKDTYWPEWLPAVIQVLSLAIILCYPGNSNLFPLNPKVIAPLASIPALLLIIGVVSKKTAFTALLQAFTGLLYITLPMVFLLTLRHINMYLPVALILMIWSNDTLAYLVGSFIGKTPFSPISPKKTWEGTAGGAILTMAGAGVYGFLSHEFHMIDCIMFALCATVAGTLGDLVESKLKRMAEVKDSGNIMPGHGGALDRFDSLLLAAPFAGAYAACFMQ